MSFATQGQYQDDFDAPTRRRSSGPAPWWVRMLTARAWRSVSITVRLLAAALFVIYAAGPKF